MELPDKSSLPPESPGKELPNDARGGGSYDVLVSAWALAHGVPVPPSIIKRIRLGFGRLIDGAFDIGANVLKNYRAKFDFNDQMQKHVVSALAKSGTSDLINNAPELANQVAYTYLSEFGLKLQNRKAVVDAAFQDLKRDPPSKDSRPEADLDPDWLNRFAETASLKSDPDMQQLMGRILAGEIRSPGSFSQLSVNILSTLSQEVARKFESLCRVSLALEYTRFISLDVFPKFLSNGIPEINFSYQDLIALRSYQLLSTEAGSGLEVEAGITPFMKSHETVYGLLCKQSLMPDNGKSSKRLPISLFTPMGAELATLVSLVPPEWFGDRLKKSFANAGWEVIIFPHA